MGRCPKKLQDGSGKSAVQKVISSFLILPLRYSRRRRTHPSLRSRHPQTGLAVECRLLFEGGVLRCGFEGALPDNSFTLQLTRSDRNLYSLDLALPPRCRARLPLVLTHEECWAAVLTREPHSPEWRSGSSALVVL